MMTCHKQCREELEAEIADLRAAIKKAAREMYVIVVRHSMVGWEENAADKIMKIQHALADAYNVRVNDGPGGGE